GTVIKSHGSADATGVAAAIGLAVRLAESKFGERLAARVASASPASQDAKSDDINSQNGATE
ncbi:MAG: phosphate acyltransferase PlsX, partial [Paracoccaceae bacterium]